MLLVLGWTRDVWPNPNAKRTRAQEGRDVTRGKQIAKKRGEEFEATLALRQADLGVPDRSHNLVADRTPVADHTRVVGRNLAAGRTPVAGHNLAAGRNRVVDRTPVVDRSQLVAAQVNTWAGVGHTAVGHSLEGTFAQGQLEPGDKRQLQEMPQLQ